MKGYLLLSWKGILSSYAQVFFSLNPIFGFSLMLISFFDPLSGFSGLMAILWVQVIVHLFNYNTDLLRNGTYTYNALLAGIALGTYYAFNVSFFVLLLASSLLSFLLTQWYLTVMGKKSLPVLTIPFLLVVWVMILGAGNFTALLPRGVQPGYIAGNYPWLFTEITALIGSLPFSNALYLYFRSLGAVLFQYNDLSGVIIAAGLMLNSRIAFVLSLFGFAVGYAFYQFMEGDFSQLIYTYIGFNFILTAIALGGFFVVPSRRSFFNLLFTIPVIALLISSLHSLLYLKWGLPLYSLPFNIAVLLILAALQNRTRVSGLSLVTLQQYSPEKHHYNFFSYAERFQKNTLIQVSLPVMGEWYISQGIEGVHTHKKEWKHAWDFDVRDESGKTFGDAGTRREDYYCYNLPVISPADGWIVDLADDVDDNEIGKVNLTKNWGNAVVIKHGDYLYSKLTHFRKNSFKVKTGDYVRKGDVIGYCGSSGRSPEPHLHMQFQATPYIGSSTILYPFSYYITRNGNKFRLNSYEYPKLGERVSNVRTTNLLTTFFSFIPGKIFKVVDSMGVRETWEVLVTPDNLAYIWCHETNAMAWFVNNGTVFYCYSYEGNRKSLLYSFFLAAYKIPLGYYKGLESDDHISILDISNYLLRFLHDFTAPFFHYVKARYHFRFISADNEHSPEELTYFSEHNLNVFGYTRNKIHFRSHVTAGSMKLECERGRNKNAILCELQ